MKTTNDSTTTRRSKSELRDLLIKTLDGMTRECYPTGTQREVLRADGMHCETFDGTRWIKHAGPSSRNSKALHPYRDEEPPWHRSRSSPIQ